MVMSILRGSQTHLLKQVLQGDRAMMILVLEMARGSLMTAGGSSITSRPPPM